MQGMNVGQLKEIVKDLPADMPVNVAYSPSKELQHDPARQHVPVEGSMFTKIKPRAGVLTVGRLKKAIAHVADTTPVVIQAYPPGKITEKVHLMQVILAKQDGGDIVYLAYDAPAFKLMPITSRPS